MSDLHNLEDLLKELEGAAIRTSQGSFVKMEDVRRLIDERNVDRAIGDSVDFKGKTFREAHRAIKEDKVLIPPKNPTVGRAIPAQEPHSPSRA
jgi:hypothetical protein